MKVETAKEKVIREAYQKLGFIWIKIEHMVTEDGVIILPSPQLKKLEGYDNLISDKDHYVSFGNSGLKLIPSCLKGVYNNNGWIRIESEADFPKVIGFYWVASKDFYATQCHYEDIRYGYHTHYQPILKPEPPIY